MKASGTPTQDRHCASDAVNDESLRGGLSPVVTCKEELWHRPAKGPIKWAAPALFATADAASIALILILTLAARYQLYNIGMSPIAYIWEVL